MVPSWQQKKKAQTRLVSGPFCVVVGVRGWVGSTPVPLSHYRKRFLARYNEQPDPWKIYGHSAFVCICSATLTFATPATPNLYHRFLPLLCLSCRLCRVGRLSMSKVGGRAGDSPGHEVLESPPCCGGDECRERANEGCRKKLVCGHPCRGPGEGCCSVPHFSMLLLYGATDVRRYILVM